MSPYHHNRDITALLEAAQHWRNTYLLNDGSLFGEKSLWTRELLGELDNAFVQNPLEGNESYLEKLKLQLSDVSPPAARFEVVQLERTPR